ncbi:Bet v I domain [Macleaya cordata]|uniref:Bet v I domain n=1 Tax=Macleaya cordata TaxID=56857 RepID=A0A200Q7U4_MACCD|nr:Bet v I domain [Macleaya cordata]
MAQIHKLEVQHEAKSSADKLYGMFTRNAPQLPKYFPQTLQNVQVIGNGISLGTVFVWNYVLGK